MNRAAVLVIAAALLAAPCAGHVDDTDAQLYQVLARNMASSHRWLEPGLPPASATSFREHLPFGLWPYVAAVRAFGEKALPWVGGLFSLLTIASLIAFGDVPGIAAALVLATTETFFLYGARSRLDPPLLLFSTLSALLVLQDRPRWALAAIAASIAALIKGPFGLLALACAACARAFVERQPRVLLRGVAMTVLAAAPAALFIACSDPSWREGYLHAQLLASATGMRTDGSTAWWGALASIAGRFWPGLPFAIAAAFDRRNRTLAVTCALLMVAMSLPVRKVWNHQLIAYPLLALLGGHWLAPRLLRWPRLIPAAAAGALIFAASGLGRRMLPLPCVASRELARFMPPPGTPVLIVSDPPEWRTVVAIAAEQRLDPVRASSLEEVQSGGPQFALIREPLFSGPIWHETSRARGWVFATR